ncbi:dTDP-glucose 4,6-dehydratase [Candidatus Beckwithbacteria bacterium CG23_combo_of_CG06-09_8_20_14_all_34_8]|uniref:dTDP-glucose 4,6-dehydratase n=1 Tax=Candidatus Beckwithbacteria bacterium CG23_combo_of_CG06-09_8_20_14_all_34_8 TaxID=1974497 RepID=A0A2H0B5K2_9BACT|nr:MAG: dTDP-glucose 4,6-dehydratase [Candidatus Beckwithbacteria bacterium CG23_combo_of_CG06-09_8_20_14_all_34_8]
MKLLITGGAGFIGSNFIRHWFKSHSDDQIVNFDKLTYAGNLENLTDIENNPNYTFIKGDICDKKAIELAFHDIDIVVHFAAESHVDRSILDPDSFVKTNVYGTYVLLEQARKQNVRFHHISTDEVFGSLELGSDTKFNENTAYDPSSPYSASKAGSDHLVRAYHRTFNLPVTISNCSNNFGPYHFPEKFIPLAITNILEGKKVPVYGAGNQVRDWLYVDDHCRGIELIIEKGVIGETYCLGGLTKDISNLDVVKMIIKIMNKGEEFIQYVKDRPGHDVRYTIDWSKANRQLGYKPAYTFEQYLQQTIAWYTEHKDWWKRVKSGAYQDYYQKQYDER